MSGKITFVVGGARSGKSSFVLREASILKGPKAYIATGEALDEEMQRRISKHREDRGPAWNTYEEPVSISKVLSDIKDNYGVIVIDCLTLWLSNVFTRTQSPDNRIQTTEESIEELIDTLNNFKKPLPVTRNASRLFIVSNELGMGIVPENALAREFRDMAGFLNQKVAALADEVYLVAAGIPVKIK